MSWTACRRGPASTSCAYAAGGAAPAQNCRRADAKMNAWSSSGQRASCSSAWAPAPGSSIEQSTTLLGDWYATVLPWRPRQAGLFVSERTLLPVLMPLAPATTLLDRFPAHLAQVLARHDVDAATVAKGCIDTTDYQVAARDRKPQRRRVHERVRLPGRAIPSGYSDVDLTDLSVQLSSVPCGPLYPRHQPRPRTPALLKDL